MKLLVKILVMFSCFSVSHAFAQTSGQKAVSGVFGFFSSGLGTISDSDNSGNSTLSGLFGLGGDFDYFIDSDISVGAILRYYSTTDSLNHTDYTNTLTTLGGVLRAYLVDTRNWSFVGTTGLGLTGATVKSSPANPNNAKSVDSGMGFGLYLGMGVMYKLNSTTRVGVENMRILGLGDRLNGWVLSDYMAKATFFF